MSRLTNTQIKSAFDRIAPRYNDVVSHYAVKRRGELLAAWTRGRVLEVGAGSGLITRQLMRWPRVTHITATDIAPNMVKELKKIKNITALVADAERLPFVDDSFDTVVASEVIYYLKKPNKLIREANRVLHKNGHLLLSCATGPAVAYDHLRTLLRRVGITSQYFNDPVKSFMGASKLRTLFKNNNFKIVEEKFILPFPHQWFDKINKTLEQTKLDKLGSFVAIKAKKVTPN